MRKTRSSLSISSIMASRRASRNRIVRMKRLLSAREGSVVGGGFQDRKVRLRALFGELHSRLHLGLDVVFQRLQARLGVALAEQPRPRTVNGVLLLALVEL